MSKILERNLSRKTRNRALIAPSGDYGWKKDFIYEALDEIAELNYAVIGCEVWAVEIERDEKVLDVFEELFLTVKDAHIDAIPCKGGKIEIFNLSCGRRENETWNEYIKRSRDEAVAFIKGSTVEERAVESLKDNIFYNPVFIDEKGYEKIDG